MDDLISRQAAIEAIGEVHPLDYNGQAILERIKALPTAEKVGNIPFRVLKVICCYHTLSYDADKGIESACHSTANMKDGESWGECNERDCPFWEVEG